ncbi:restriction endonuclease [Archangium gephyra]|uniref:restriction endonuclease n=1 Tax=Archangium gephyra TaxID=48 RepID=UPI0035D4FA79
MKIDLYTDFLRIQNIENQAQRGREFESLCFRLFFEHGFKTERNPRSASPRQTDIFAQHRGKDYIIETKWLSRLIGTPEIDALRSRLNRVPTDMVGCFVSMSEYAPTAIAEVERDRTREILLIGPEEIQALVSGKLQLPKLLEKKRESLRKDGQVWFHQLNQKARRSKPVLPTSAEFLDDGQQQVPSFLFKAESTTLFTREILSFDPGTPGEDGVELTLRPRIQTRTELGEFFTLLAQTLKLSGGGTFAIHNPGDPDQSWHGIGLTNFLEELEGVETRYTSNPHVHPYKVELISYLAECRGGFLAFESQHRIKHQGVLKYDRGRLEQTEITIHLPGIPVDLDPFIRLCGEMGNPFATFNPIWRKQHEFGPIWDRVRLEKAISLEVVGRVLQRGSDDDEDDDERLSVSGIVARNPFFKKPKQIARFVKMGSKLSPLRDLETTEFLICFLRDWLGPEDVVDHYFLTQVEATWIGSHHIMRPVCTWGEILNKPKKRSLDAMPSLQEPLTSHSTRKRQGKSLSPRTQFSGPRSQLPLRRKGSS